MAKKFTDFKGGDEVKVKGQTPVCSLYSPQMIAEIKTAYTVDGEPQWDDLKKCYAVQLLTLRGVFNAAKFQKKSETSAKTAA